jgi:stage IV sporulation protein A
MESLVSDSLNIYKDISLRTGGDIYIGVVGPVRTGKSTFIKRFMDLLVLPNIANVYGRERAKDELPQSAAGKTIMTTEPKFVPNEAVEITLNGDLHLKVRLIDCVGYPVDGAGGYTDGDEPRMVNTPWSEEKMPFERAAEIGTRKVITEHSTIGVVVTTDGSIGELEREGYVAAEERVIKELKELNKPFVVILNTVTPFSEQTESLALDMRSKYDVPIIPMNCAQLKSENITGILEQVLYEFPLGEVGINLPRWMESLPLEHSLKNNIIECIKAMPYELNSLKEVKLLPEIFTNNEDVKKAFVTSIDPGTGRAQIDITMADELFYSVLSETTGTTISDETELIETIRKLSEAKQGYDRVRFALEEVNRKGYGVVMPTPEEMELTKPEVAKHGGKYGIRLKASAPSIHLVRADIETTVAPIVGSEEQSKELADYLSQQLDGNRDSLWSYNIFGRSLSDMVKEDLNAKLSRIPEDAQMKLQETLQKIMNEGHGGLICILL